MVVTIECGQPSASVMYMVSFPAVTLTKSSVVCPEAQR